MDAHLLIFSKDRAAQVDQLLRSMKAHFRLAHHVHLLYNASDQAHAAGYRRLLEEHHAVVGIDERETDVDTAVRQVVETASARFFGMLVDDDVMIRDVASGDAPLRKLEADGRVACVSLRLSPGKTHSQTHALPMRVPCLVDGTFDFDPPRPPWALRHMQWPRAIRRMLRLPKRHYGGWRVPFSVDGNLFVLDRFRAFLRRLPRFTHVTSVEPAMMAHRAQWGGPLWGAIYPEERLINLVMNNVDTQGARYPHPGHSLSETNARYLAGDRLDYAPYVGASFDACHVEAAPQYVRR